MDWQMIWQTDFWGTIYFVVFVAVVLMAIYFFLSLLVKTVRCYSRQTPDKNHPEKVLVRIDDGLFITLERIRLKGEWRYILDGELPYKFVSPEEEYEEIAKTTPRAIAK